MKYLFFLFIFISCQSKDKKFETIKYCCEHGMVPIEIGIGFYKCTAISSKELKEHRDYVCEYILEECKNDTI